MKPGDVIDGKYQVETELGEGGMGRVLAARHLTLGSAVAIKVLRGDSLKYPDVPRRFLREARAAGRLRSEHVVKVTDVGELATGEPYMVMELLHGFDLSSRIKQGPVAPALAVEYIAQACAGLAEAHAMGMVHRDVKPANLFVTQRPNGAPLVKVLDFGIATAATGDVDHNLTTTLTVIGSPSYMSPEQLHAARDVDARSDIWSLGVTLYELVSGRQPFLGPTITALTLKIVGEPHERLPGASPELAAIVDRCLAKQREDRYANVAELVRALAPLFPNGRVAAEMVAGSLSQVAAPSVAELGGSTIGVDPTAYPVAPAEPVKSTTTDLGAGESAAPIERAGKQFRTWVAVGAVLAGAIVAFGLVVSQGGGERPARPSAGGGDAAPVADTSPGSEIRGVGGSGAIADTMPAAVGSGSAVAETAAGSSAGSSAGSAASSPGAAAGSEEAAEASPQVAEAQPGRPPPAKSRPGRPARKPAPSKPSARDPRVPVEPEEYTRPPAVEPEPRKVEPEPHKVEPEPRKVEPEPRKVEPEPRTLPCAPNDPRCGL